MTKQYSFIVGVEISEKLQVSNLRVTYVAQEYQREWQEFSVFYHDDIGELFICLTCLPSCKTTTTFKGTIIVVSRYADVIGLFHVTTIQLTFGWYCTNTRKPTRYSVVKYEKCKTQVSLLVVIIVFISKNFTTYVGIIRCDIATTTPVTEK